MREDGTTTGDGPAELAELAPGALRRGRSHEIDLGDRRVLADVLGPPTRLLVYGAVDTADALCRAAKLLGWHDDRRRRPRALRDARTAAER